MARSIIRMRGIIRMILVMIVVFIFIGCSRRQWQRHIGFVSPVVRRMITMLIIVGHNPTASSCVDIVVGR